MSNLFDMVIFLLIGGALLGAGIGAWLSTNTTGWDSTTKTIFLLVPVIGVAIIIYGIAKKL